VAAPSRRSEAAGVDAATVGRVSPAAHLYWRSLELGTVTSATRTEDP